MGSHTQNTDYYSLHGKFTRQSKLHHADLRQDPHREDHHPRGRALRLYREREGQDSGQGRNSPRSAEVDLRRKAAGGRKNSLRLQHPEGEHSSPGSQTQGRKLKWLTFHHLIWHFHFWPVFTQTKF